MLPCRARYVLALVGATTLLVALIVPLSSASSRRAQQSYKLRQYGDVTLVNMDLICFYAPSRPVSGKLGYAVCNRPSTFGRGVQIIHRRRVRPRRQMYQRDNDELSPPV